MVDELENQSTLEPELDANEDQDTVSLTPYTNEFGTIIPTSMVEEMQRSYLDYAMSVIVSRALPDVRDGLKPVHRRILFAMKELGIHHRSAYKKSARIVGEVLGKYHPHGDTAVYDALVRLAQDFSMRYPLIDGQGNFGSIDGDSAAAMRYTEARLAAITEEILVDLDKNTVPMVDNFDGSQQEPSVMPAALPNLLLMGGDGIAVGMATKIPPHNLGEVVDAIVAMIKAGTAKELELPTESRTEEALEAIEPSSLITSFESQATIDELLEHIQGPDFPTGGIMYDWAAIREVYTTGRGRILTRAKADIVETKSGRYSIIIDEIPYQVNKARLIAKIADLVRDKKLLGISNLRDESDRQGMRIVIELKKDAVPKSVLNNLYKYTQLQDTFAANVVALSSEGAPSVMNLRTILSEYLHHRRTVVVRRSQYELKTARARAHILEGLLKALDILDQVIALIRGSKDAESAKRGLVEEFGFTELQAVAILDMQLRKLAALERQKLQDEYAELRSQIEALVTLLTNPNQVLAVISTELLSIKERYGDERRTKLVRGKIGEISDEDLIASEDVIIALTKTGYIKRMPISLYRSQRRGGQGVAGMTTKDEDSVDALLSVNTHDRLLVFTNRGKVYVLRVMDVPEGSRQAKGAAIINLIQVDQGEMVKAVIPVTKSTLEDQDSHIFLATQKGLVKKTSMNQFQNIRATGIIAIVLRDGDELVWGSITSGKDEIILVSHQGKSIRFTESDLRPTARDTQGVRGILLKGDDYVVAAQKVTEQEAPSDGRKRFFHDFLIVTERGLGKRTPVTDYPNQKRGGQGVKVATLSTKTGNIAGARIVTPEDDQVMILTSKAQVIKLPLRNIPQLKRPTQGVILMRLTSQDDKVVSVTTVRREADDQSE